MNLAVDYKPLHALSTRERSVTVRALFEFAEGQRRKAKARHNSGPQNVEHRAAHRRVAAEADALAIRLRSEGGVKA